MNNIGTTLKVLRFKRDYKSYRKGGMTMSLYDRYGFDFNKVFNPSVDTPSKDKNKW